MRRLTSFVAGVLLAVSLGVVAQVSGVPQKLRLSTLGVGVAAPATPGTINALAIQVNGTAIAAGFSGATVRKTATQGSLSSAGTLIAVSFDAELTDTGTFHDNVTNNSRVLLPTQTGRAQCSANVTGATATTTAATASETRTYICLNGAGSCASGTVVASETPLYDDGGTAGGTFLPTWRTSMVTPIIEVVGGDYAEVFVFFQGYSANTNSVNIDSANSNSQARFSCWSVK